MTEQTYFGKKRRKKKKTKKEKVENLYKILGTRSNIGQGRIREKYIEKLREFPPETHPEEFQEIRRAYETLKDINKRKQYDMMRKYGDSLEDAMDEVMYLMSVKEFEKAEKLIDDILEIDSDNIPVRLTKSKLLLEIGKVEEFSVLMDEIVEMSDIEGKQYILFIEFNMLTSKEYYDKAFAKLDNGKEYITDLKEYHKIRAAAFLESENLEDAWNELKSAYPSSDNLTIGDLDLLVFCLNTIMELEKWGEVSKVQNYLRKMAKAIVDEEELSMIKGYLLEEAELYVDVSRYREADVFMQIASQICKNDRYIKERKNEIQGISRLEKELIRSSKDHDLIPYVHVNIVDLFLSEYGNHDSYADFLNDYPHEMMRELEDMKEDIASGVLRVKKKYPILYKEFRKELDELFDESTEGLNREQRRALR